MSAATRVYLALGSNRGEAHERLGLLREAVELLEKWGDLQVEARSKIYHTQSVEGGGEGDFSNAAIRATTSLSAPDLLDTIHSVESQLGRAAPENIGEHRVGSRSIDIDILLFGGETHASPELEIPHPRALYRAFVLRPLLDVLEGGWIEATAQTL